MMVCCRRDIVDVLVRIIRTSVCKFTFLFLCFYWHEVRGELKKDSESERKQVRVLLLLVAQDALFLDLVD